MNFKKFLTLMDTLLSESGCPWDREQTHESLRQYLLEECYETIDAIDNSDMAALCEELGDVLLQVVFHSKLAEKAGAFTIEDVISAVSHKLTSRHTHVFGGDTVTNAEDVIDVWEANKQKERQHSPAQAMEAVPKAFPALMRASKVMKRASSDKPEAEGLLQCLRGAIDSLEEAQEGHDKLLGEMLLQVASLSNVYKVNAELALANAVDKFIAQQCQV